jgi:hypothetical protein
MSSSTILAILNRVGAGGMNRMRYTLPSSASENPSTYQRLFPAATSNVPRMAASVNGLGA